MDCTERALRHALMQGIARVACHFDTQLCVSVARRVYIWICSLLLRCCKDWSTLASSLPDRLAGLCFTTKLSRLPPIPFTHHETSEYSATKLLALHVIHMSYHLRGISLDRDVHCTVTEKDMNSYKSMLRQNVSNCMKKASNALLSSPVGHQSRPRLFQLLGLGISPSPRLTFHSHQPYRCAHDDTQRPESRIFQNIIPCSSTSAAST